MTAEPLAPTATLEQVTGCVWDVVAIGAGPAGASAAYEMARRGATVLLVDKEAFPRRKVCGCCINGSALATLSAIGLKTLPAKLGGRPLRTFCVATRGRRVTLPLAHHVALSRQVFDAALVNHAIRAGAHFLPQTTARLGPLGSETRCISLSSQGREIPIAARVVLTAEGLAGRARSTAEDSRIGAGAIMDEAPRSYSAGTVFMACGSGGYVGLVRLEDDRLNVAAAFDPAFVRRAGSLGMAAALIIEQAGFPPIKELPAALWRGTPALTSHSKTVAAERVFVLGDSVGYVEPFTGEGIAWALASGVTVAPIAERAVRTWTSSLADQWAATHRRLIGRRQNVCRVLARALKSPALVCAMVGILSKMPAVAVPILRMTNAPTENLMT